MVSGQPVIVTNAKKSWVYQSSQALMPKTYQIIMSSVLVVSAREDHEQEHPLEAHEWKQKAFLLLRDNKNINFSHDKVTNLIVIGDSRFEIDAGVTLSQNIEKCLIKTVKLSETPTANELIK